MHHDFWHDKWQQNQIGFHEGTVNAYLKAYWPTLQRSIAEPVFVPLCGKSHDLFWINNLGHPVLGVELSPIACKDLFEEAGISAEVTQVPPYIRFAHNDLSILCGDFFSLTAADIAPAKLLYDRAALIALPPEMRKQYVAQLNRLMPEGAEGLLVTLEYPQQEMSGPPFSVLKEEVLTLYERIWQVEQIHEKELSADDPFAKRRGLSKLKERVYRLRKIP